MKKIFKTSVIFFFLLILGFYACSRLSYVISNDYQVEYREGVGVKFAVDFAHGINPYSLKVLENDNPAELSVYGFLPPLIASIFIKILFFADPLLVCQILTLIVEYASILFFILALNLKIKNLALSILGGMFYTCCFYRCGAIAGFFPDSYGLFLSTLLMFLLQKDHIRSKYSPLLYDVIIVLLFYCKNYFVLLGLGVLVFLLIHSKKDGIKFLVYGLIFGILSMIIVQIIFPLYFTETLAICALMVSGDNSSSASSFSPLKYSLKQFKFLLCNQFFVILLIYVISSFYSIKDFISNLKNDFSIKAEGLFEVNFSKKHFYFAYEILQMICMLLPTIYFSQNIGAWLSYPLQFWFPYTIYAGFVLADFVLKKHKYDFAIVFMLSLFCVFSFKNILPYVYEKYDKKDQEAWNKAISIIAEYGNDKKIYSRPHFGYYCIKNGIYSDAQLGQSTGSKYSLEKYNSSRFWKLVFPYAGKLIQQGYEYNQKIFENVQNMKYSIIILTEPYNIQICPETLNEYGYVLKEDVSLRTGMQVWQTKIFIRP